MKRFALVGVVLLAFVVGSVVGLATSRQTPTVQAQDDMTHVCDSSTILLLFVAEYDYGYHSEDMDLASFEKGQFGFLFDSMMTMMDDMDDMDDEMMMDDEAMAEAEGMIMGMMDEMDDMTMLSGFEGEDEACTALRADLEHYLTISIYADLTMDDMMEEE
jgi:hypothetical protein